MIMVGVPTQAYNVVGSSRTSALQMDVSVSVHEDDEDGGDGISDEIATDEPK